MWWFLLGFAVAVVIDIIFDNLIFRTSGTLKIDHSNPEKDTYRFEIDDLEKLSHKRKIVLKIDNNADLSQK